MMMCEKDGRCFSEIAKDAYGGADKGELETARLRIADLETEEKRLAQKVLEFQEENDRLNVELANAGKDNDETRSRIKELEEERDWLNTELTNRGSEDAKPEPVPMPINRAEWLPSWLPVWPLSSAPLLVLGAVIMALWIFAAVNHSMLSPVFQLALMIWWGFALKKSSGPPLWLKLALWLPGPFIGAVLAAVAVAVQYSRNRTA